METQQILDLTFLIENIRVAKQQMDEVLKLMKEGYNGTFGSLGLDVQGVEISFMHLADKEVDKIMMCFVDVSNYKIEEAKKRMVEIIYPATDRACTPQYN